MSDKSVQELLEESRELRTGIAEAPRDWDCSVEDCDEDFNNQISMERHWLQEHDDE